MELISKCDSLVKLIFVQKVLEPEYFITSWCPLMFGMRMRVRNTLVNIIN